MLAPDEFRFGFRVVGEANGARRYVDWQKAFDGYTQCSSAADLDAGGFLSAFLFDAALKDRLESRGELNVSGYDGPCWSPWLWIDIDRDNREVARQDAVRLIEGVRTRYGECDDQLLVFFSGNKGFHIGIPTTWWEPEPSVNFHREAAAFAAALAGHSQVEIDSSVYKKVQLFRAPNSRHPKSGLFKRAFGVRDFRSMTMGAIEEASRMPTPVELQTPADSNSELARADWASAVSRVQSEQDRRAAIRVEAPRGEVFDSTRFFIRNGASNGSRNNNLYRAAANLAELGCPESAVTALLMSPAIESGLSDDEARRTIQSALRRGGTCE